jgi:signal transduction histidine kinase
MIRAPEWFTTNIWPAVAPPDRRGSSGHTVPTATSAASAAFPAPAAVEAPEFIDGEATHADRRRTFLLVRYVLIIAVSALAIFNVRDALASSQILLIVVALLSNAALGRVNTAQFFRWWVQGPVVLVDTVWIAVVLLSTGFQQQFFLFYFIELFLAAIGESLGLLALGAVILGTASITIGNEGVLTAATLIRVPFFFATAVFYGYVLDLTKQQRRLTLQRAAWAKQLETEVHRRTRELERQSAELRRMYDEVCAAERLKADFVANMSHELRTPVHIIMGYTDLALEDPHLPTDGELRTYLRRIAGRAHGLRQLIDNVLDYANLERGRVAVSPRRFPLDTLLGDLRAFCDDIPHPQDVAVRLASAPEIEVTTDYDRLLSVLSHLLLNATKFTPAGEVGLTVREARDQIELSVCDTGIGIPPQEINHIFEPFRQADGSSTRPFGGVGLGLAIVSRNLKLLDGRIEVESEIGRGSTFRVCIPRRIAGGGARA